ncbi:MAG: DNA repair protein [Polyangiaceae bacterium]|nr:DNA repair protein [Polyangiaceae bacterium]MCL4751468.1 DNA repair protein [Myxococcales bacterium]
MQHPASTSADPSSEHAAAGPNELGDVELLSLLVGPARRRGARTPAARLLDHAGGLAGIARMGARDIAVSARVRTDRALRVSAAIELGRRVHAALVEPRGETIGSFREVERWAAPRLVHLEHEEVWLLCLDGRNTLKSARRVAQGGAHGCALTPRDVLTPALREAASAIVLVHNHPSGDPTPSPEDVHMTRAVAGACEVVGVPLLDHVVVAKGGASSVFEALEP